MDKQNKNIKHKTTPWSLFRDYLTNIISGKEMHAIEKEIMGNPLESDALDGFDMFAPASIENDLKNLKTRIERKTGYYTNTKTIASKQLIRIAAIALLVLFSATIVILLTRNSDKVLSPTLSESRLTETTIPTTPTLQNDSEALEFEPIIVSQESDADAKNSATVSSDYEMSKAKKIHKTPSPKIEFDTNEFNLNESLSPKTISTKKSESLKPTSTIEPVLMIDEDIVEKNDTKIETIENQVNVLAIQESNIKIEEIATPAPLSKSVSADTQTKYDVIESAVSAMPPKVMSQYVATIKTAALNDIPELDGEFEVWFNVDAKGNMDSFDVAKSLGRKNDKRIIRIIEDQGKWNPAYKNSKPIESITVIQIDFTKK